VVVCDRKPHAHDGSGTLGKLCVNRWLQKIRSHLVLFRIISSFLSRSGIEVTMTFVLSMVKLTNAIFEGIV
jgi:hypothetical protein